MENQEQPIQQQVNTQPLSEPSFEPKKSLPKLPLIIVAVILIAILLLTGGYFFAQNSNNKVVCTTEAKLCPDGSSVGRTGPKCEFSPCPKTPTATPTLAPVSTESGALIATDTATWKTYTNSFFNFSLKYPQDWKILDQKSTNNFNEGAKRNLKYDYTRLGLVDNDLILNIELTENPFVSPEPIKDSEKIQLQGVPAHFYSYFEEGPMPARGYWTWLSFLKDRKAYSIYLVSPEKEGSKEELMKSIISTLKFTQ